MNAPAPTTQAPAPEKRQVDYDRIIKELEKAKEWMGIHWDYEDRTVEKKKPNLRTFTDEHGLEYVRMINHTYPLKKMENLEVCEKYLDEEIKSMKAKKDKQANPQPKEKKAKPCLIKAETHEMEIQTDSDASTVVTEPPEHVALTPEEYTKLCAGEHNQRVGLTVRLRKMADQYNQLLDMLKERDDDDEWRETLDDEEKALLKRKLVIGGKTDTPPKVFATNDEVRTSIQKKMTSYDEQAKRIADQKAREEADRIAEQMSRET
jgi:hypothetical protein